MNKIELKAVTANCFQVKQVGIRNPENSKTFNYSCIIMSTDNYR